MILLFADYMGLNKLSLPLTHHLPLKDLYITVICSLGAPIPPPGEESSFWGHLLFIVLQLHIILHLKFRTCVRSRKYLNKLEYNKF